MFDIRLRSLKDNFFDPCCRFIPSQITPYHVTAAAFLAGLLSCYCAYLNSPLLSAGFWALNRFLDCLDGALARHRNTASDLGGFLDLLGDFIVYSIIPITISAGQESTIRCWQAVAILEATFHVNNFILFYIAAISEKRQAKDSASGKELTSVMMRPALVEGLESGVLFTGMLVFPGYIEGLCWLMAVLVSVGIVQRTAWVIPALG